MRWEATDDPDRVWWPVAYAGLELLLHGPLDRIKGCGGCRYLFLDETKNRSRRWCSMDDCGTREKMRTYVARRAARRSGQVAPQPLTRRRPAGREPASLTAPARSSSSNTTTFVPETAVPRLSLWSLST